MASTKDKATSILGKPVTDYISRKLRSGSAWRDISRDLFIDTAGVIDVSVATLKNWANSPKVPLTT